MQDICAIITTFNSEKFIECSLNSILNQTLQPKEIIVLDDGSNDNTSEILKKYKNKIKYLHFGHQGIPITRNLAIEHTNCDFIMFLDADDIWPNNKIEIISKNIKNDVDAVVGKTQIFINNDDNVLSIKNLFQTPFFGLSLCAAAINRKSILSLGGFDINLQIGEDSDFWFRMRESNKNIIFIEDLCLYYRRHSANTTSNYEKTNLAMIKTIRSSLARRRIASQNFLNNWGKN